MSFDHTHLATVAFCYLGGIVTGIGIGGLIAWGALEFQERRRMKAWGLG